MLKRVTPQPHHRYYVLIVNCGGDSKVKSDILERYHHLKESGYSAILGLRDVYGQFRYEDVTRLRNELHVGLPRSEPEVHLFLAIMEIEAWFLAEHTHYRRVSPDLTLERIRREFHFDPEKDDLERRWHPAEDLDRIYQMVGQRYSKQRGNVERMLEVMDFPFFVSEVAGRFRDAERLVEVLRIQFSEGDSEMTDE